MSNTTIKKPLVAAIGVAIVGSLAATGSMAADNPFGLSELSGGYMQTAMEGKCGGDKAMEGKCGGDMAKKAVKTMEGKCGEGKCGGSK